MPWGAAGPREGVALSASSLLCPCGLLLARRLFTAVIVMLLSANAKRLMVGYLLGAYTTSIGLGLVILFALPGSSTVSTARQTVNPAIDIALGVLALVFAFVVGSGPHDRAQRRHERRREKKEKKGPPRWRRALDKGSPRATFAVAMVLSLPGARYLVAVDVLHKQHLGTATKVVCVIAFCLVALMLIELPLLGFAFARVWTVKTVESFNAWVARDGRRIATIAALVVGVLLVLWGILELV